MLVARIRADQACGSLRSATRRVGSANPIELRVHESPSLILPSASWHTGDDAILPHVLGRLKGRLDAIADRLVRSQRDVDEHGFLGSLFWRSIEQLVAWPRWMLGYWLDSGPHFVAKALALPWMLVNCAFWLFMLAGLGVGLGLVMWLLWQLITSITS